MTDFHENIFFLFVGVKAIFRLCSRDSCEEIFLLWDIINRHGRRRENKFQ
jgi:hypothetical protein